MEIQALNLKYR